MSDNQRMFSHPKIVPEDLAVLHTQVFTWWQAAGRVLPWREKMSAGKTMNHTVRDAAFTSYFANSLQRDPYRVVVSEMMLQQTQVERVLPKFTAWLAKWPSTAELARASLAEVLIMWQGLGYNRRAKFLWQLAQQIEQRDGIWPTTEVELLELPGIGQYTARAIMSFAMRQQVGVVDTNIKRVLARVTGIEWSEKQVIPPLKAKVNYFSLADELLPIDQADPWNQAIMDLGAMICVARAPKCERCPIAKLCQVNLHAQKHGWANYAEWLAENRAQDAAKTAMTAPKKIRFADTDRFFRGRIMDLLRVESYDVKKLAETMENDFGLIDQTRFQKLLAGLAAEELLTIQEKKVMLG